MPDEVYDYAVALRDHWARKISEGQQHVEAMRKELRAVEAFLEQYAQFAAKSQGPAVASDDLSDSKPRLVRIPTFDSASPRLRNSKKEEVARMAREILAEEDKPLPRKDLLKAISERGIIVSGKDPEMVLSTMMWRMQNEFVRLPSWGYWFRSRPYGPAGYDPLVPYPADDEHSEIVQRDLAGTLPRDEE
jgi:HB1, ASXL, restriction endonuclease HTH domain